jgi:complement component 1 Q subcomponent-binding protein
MHSFRALARAAPRATARLTASSARASIRPAFTNSIRTQAPRAITAAFSTSRPTFDASSQELAAKLTSELSIESENAESTASDSNVQNFLGRTDWQLHDVDGEQIVKHEDADEALMDDEMDFPEGQSGGAHTKGAINQGNNRSDGNFKVAPEDSIAPADREGLRDEEVRLRRDLDTAIAILIHSSRTTPILLSPPTSTS